MSCRGVARWLALLTLVAMSACAGGPPTGTGPSAAPGREPSEWERIVVAASREGGIVIYGPQGADVRDVFVEGFQRRYPEIQVDFTGGFGTQLVPKLLTERGAGQYRVDIFAHGTTSVITDLMGAGAIQAIRPFLVGPELQDTSPWMGGALDYADNAQMYDLVYATNVKSPVAYNPALVAPGEFKSWRDLLDPKWRGKIVMRDPRTAGPGLATATHLYTTEGLGKPFIEQLFATGVVFSTDDRQMLDWVARGQYLVAVAPSEVLTAELKDRGVPIELLPAEALREGSYLTSGIASISVLDQAPHPNAVKVFLNWFLSKEAQTGFSKAAGYTSRRLDVPRDHLPQHLIPREGTTMQENYKEPFIVIRDEIEAFLKSTIQS